jgi:hypothetical protein
MGKRIEIFKSFEESEEIEHKSNLRLTTWQRWVKGIELSEFSINCAKDINEIYITKSQEKQYSLILPKDKKL